MPPMQLNWDIFCRVVDNYGDIGVCWRLARQLANEHGKQVRLWVDDLTSLKPLCSMININLKQQYYQGVEVLHWAEFHAIDRVADVVVEAFACELPSAYLLAMASSTTKPCWINLEYLTAERWAEACHGMASPHPALPLTKYFFFPGFSDSTGGLLRESHLIFEDNGKQSVTSPQNDALQISLFCYDTAPVGKLLNALSETLIPVVLHVAPGKPLAAVSAHLGNNGPWQLGLLKVIPFDFLPQDDYDNLLQRCDINFVRGEDSFVRAQWAGKPFVWQIYPQDEDTHLIKLDAFLARFTEGWLSDTANATVDFIKAWNSDGNLSHVWTQYLHEISTIHRCTLQWREKLANSPDLTNQLVKFCAHRV